jgi:hypothetical protein
MTTQKSRITTAAILLAVVVAPPNTANATSVVTVSAVSPSTYNSELRTRRSLTGKPVRFRAKPVELSVYQKLRTNNRKLIRRCKASAISTGASVYGTGNDAGTIGYRGDHLPSYDDSFATLETGLAQIHAWPHRTRRWLHRGRQSARGVKRDIGHGGGRVGGFVRSIDLHAPLASKLRVSGLAVIQITRRPCRGAFR